MGAGGGLAYAQRQVLGRTALHHVLDLDIALPAFLVGLRVALGTPAHDCVIGSARARPGRCNILQIFPTPGSEPADKKKVIR